MPGILGGKVSEIHKKKTSVLLLIGGIMEFGPSLCFGFFLRLSSLE